jgi:hypothetical protein
MRGAGKRIWPRAKFVRASDFYAAIRASYNSQDGPTEQSVLYDHISPALLILDDLPTTMHDK